MARKQNKRAVPARVKLTDCVKCHGPFVNPIMDECQDTGTGWFIVTRCGNCEDEQERLVTYGRANEFDDDLDIYLHKVKVYLRLLERERFEEEIERFVLALNADAILPEDFRL